MPGAAQTCAIEHLIDRRHDSVVRLQHEGDQVALAFVKCRDPAGEKVGNRSDVSITDQCRRISQFCAQRGVLLDELAVDLRDVDHEDLGYRARYALLGLIASVRVNS